MRMALALALVVALASGCVGDPGGGTPSPPPATRPGGGSGGTDGGDGPPEPPELPDLTLQRVVDGLDAPVHLTVAGDGSGRLFIVEQPGRVRVWADGNVEDAPFLDIRDRVKSGGEQGLLSIAFYPDFAESGRVIVSYTDRGGDSVLARFTVDATDPRRLDPDSEEVLLHVEQPYANHNGGLALFGPDGFLYFGLGDGGAGGDPHGNGQDVSTLLGAILRLDVEDDGEYAIPADNPFASGGGRGEVWDFGLRNPWRFSFDRDTGDLWIADVGQSALEEVNFAHDNPPGLNFGWNAFEGTKRYSAADTRGDVVFPVAEYRHDEGGHCSVTGGFVYRGSAIPDLVGTYLYADYCSGVVWGLRAEGGEWVTRVLMETDHRITSFGEDESGELYVVDHEGSVLRVSAA